VTARLIAVLILCGLPLLAIVGGMLALDWHTARRARRLRPGVFVAPPVNLDAARQRRLRAARRDADRHLNDHRKARA